MRRSGSTSRSPTTTGAAGRPSPLTASAQDRPDPGVELGGRVGLDDVVVGTGVEQPHDLGVVVPRGGHDDGHRSTRCGPSAARRRRRGRGGRGRAPRRRAASRRRRPGRRCRGPRCARRGRRRPATRASVSRIRWSSSITSTDAIAARRYADGGRRPAGSRRLNQGLGLAWAASNAARASMVRVRRTVAFVARVVRGRRPRRRPSRGSASRSSSEQLAGSGSHPAPLSAERDPRRAGRRRATTTTTDGARPRRPRPPRPPPRPPPTPTTTRPLRAPPRHRAHDHHDRPGRRRRRPSPTTSSAAT